MVEDSEPATLAQDPLPVSTSDSDLDPDPNPDPDPPLDYDVLAGALLRQALAAIGSQDKTRSETTEWERLASEAMEDAEKAQNELAHLREDTKALHDLYDQSQMALAERGRWVEKLHEENDQLIRQLAEGAKAYRTLAAERDMLVRQHDERKKKEAQGKYRLGDVDPDGARALAEMARIMRQPPGPSADPEANGL